MVENESTETAAGRCAKTGSGGVSTVRAQRMVENESTETAAGHLANKKIGGSSAARKKRLAENESTETAAEPYETDLGELEAGLIQPM